MLDFSELIDFPMQISTVLSWYWKTINIQTLIWLNTTLFVSGDKQSSSAPLSTWIICLAVIWRQKQTHFTRGHCVISIVFQLNTANMRWISKPSSSSPSPPPLWQCCVSVEGYPNEVPSCVTNLQRGGEVVINICYQQPAYHRRHTRACTKPPQHHNTHCQDRTRTNFMYYAHRGT